jgi:hypothetical protein
MFAFDFFKKKAYIYMLIKTSKGYQELNRFKRPLNVEIFEYKNRTYQMKTEKGVLTKHNDLLFFYDVLISEPLTFHTISLVKSSHLKDVLDNNNLQQLNTKNITKTYYIMMGALVLGIIIMGAWGIWNMGESNKRILELTLKIANMTANNGVIIIP